MIHLRADGQVCAGRELISVANSLSNPWAMGGMAENNPQPQSEDE